MRVIIAGSRGINDLSVVEDAIRASGFEISEVVSGGARGVDTLGETWAKANGVQVSVYPANWGLFGKAAGYMRNTEMACNADALIAVWDGTSRGTQNMINIATHKGLKIYVHKVSGE